MKFLLISCFLSIVLIGSIAMRASERQEHVSYDQVTLYQNYEIDTIIMRNAGGGYDAYDFVRSIQVLNENGLCLRSEMYCNSGALTEANDFNRKGQKLKTIRYEFKCTGIADDQTIYLYQKGLLKQKIIAYDLKTFKLTDSWEYDSNERLIYYATYRHGEEAWFEHIAYDTVKNTSFKIRIRGYGDRDTIFTTETFFNAKGDPIKNVNRYDHIIKSEYSFEYDKFGNLSRKSAHFYPSDKMGVDQQYFYSRPHKLDSAWWLTSLSDVYNKTYYEYDQRGLLKKETHHDYKNNHINTKTYDYK